MDIKKLFKKTLFTGALYYTIITACLSAINLMLGEDMVIRPQLFLLVLLFSYVAAGCGAIAAVDGISRPVGELISAIGHIGGFFFCLVLPSDTEFTGSVIITLLFAIIYAAVRFIRAALRKKNKASSAKSASKGSSKNIPAANKSASKKSKDKEYTSMFGSGDKK